MNDVTQLLHQHDLEQAYLRITEEMGPSPQLIAFINYEKVTGNSLGLESFNIMDQHDVIINDITASDTLNVARESLLFAIRSAVNTANNATLTFNRVKRMAKGKKKGSSSRYTPQSNPHNNEIVYSVHDVETFKNNAQSLFKLENDIAKMIPHGFSVHEWETFYKEANHLITQFNKSSSFGGFTWGHQVPRVKEVTKKTPWKNAGWTSIQVRRDDDWVEEFERNIERLSSSYTSKLKAIAHHLEKPINLQTDDVKAIRDVHGLINKTVISTSSVFSRSLHYARMVKNAIEEAEHFLDT